jgi:hypothetical protein
MIAPFGSKRSIYQDRLLGTGIGRAALKTTRRGGGVSRRGVAALSAAVGQPGKFCGDAIFYYSTCHPFTETGSGQTNVGKAAALQTRDENARFLLTESGGLEGDVLERSSPLHQPLHCCADRLQHHKVPPSRQGAGEPAREVPTPANFSSVKTTETSATRVS